MGSGITPLMWATNFGSDEAVSMLLKLGADANTVENVEGYNALEMAIDEKLISTSLLLLDRIDITGRKGIRIVTNGSESGMTKVVEPVLNYYYRENKDLLLEAVTKGFRAACMFGHAMTAKTLLQFVNMTERTNLCRKNLKCAIKSDNPQTVGIVMENLSEVHEDTIREALKRRNGKIIEILSKKDRTNLLVEHGTEMNIASILKLKKQLEENSIIANEKNIMSFIVKDREFEYLDMFENFEEILDEDNTVSVENLIKHLKAPTVHLDICRKDCKKSLVCQMIREALKVQQDILEKMGERHDIFKGATAWPVGSIVEDSRYLLEYAVKFR